MNGVEDCVSKIVICVILKYWEMSGLFAEMVAHIVIYHIVTIKSAEKLHVLCSDER